MISLASDHDINPLVRAHVTDSLQEYHGKLAML